MYNKEKRNENHSLFDEWLEARMYAIFHSTNVLVQHVVNAERKKT